MPPSAGGAAAENPKPTDRLIADAQHALALVRCGDTWGSGIHIGSGYVLTCAHVVVPIPAGGKEQSARTPSSSRPVAVRLRRRGGGAAVHDAWFAAATVYASAGPVDVALLRLGGRLVDAAAAASAAGPRAGAATVPVGSIAGGGFDAFGAVDLWAAGGGAFPPAARGQRVLVLGYGLFEPGLGLPPLVTAGTLTRVVLAPRARGRGGPPPPPPAMLLSCAAVFRGHSGGMLLDARTGALRGLVTNNAQGSSGATLPRLNFSVPVAGLLALGDVALADLACRRCADAVAAVTTARQRRRWGARRAAAVARAKAGAHDARLADLWLLEDADNDVNSGL